MLIVSALSAADPLYRAPVEHNLTQQQALYFCAYVQSEVAAPAILVIGSTGPIKVWLNGAEVSRETTTQPKLESDTNRAFMQLAEGLNFILLKRCGPGPSACRLKLVGTDGKPIPAVTFRNPLDPGIETKALTCACIGPFACYKEACVLDTRFLPERDVAGPPRDASCARRWTVCGKRRPDPAPKLLNGGFEFIDDQGAPYAWFAVWGQVETSTQAAAGQRALRLPASPQPVSREVQSHPFRVDVRRPARVSLQYKLIPAGHGLPDAASSIALDCWIQWLNADMAVIAATPICCVSPTEASSGQWRTCRSKPLRPPFASTFARMQLKTWRSRSEVLIDEVAFEQ